MNHQTIEHLQQVDHARREAMRFVAIHAYPDELRTVITIGMLDVMFECHAAMLMLIRNATVGSALALARGLVETMFRGVWALGCATDQQLKDFERDDRLPLNLRQMAQAADTRFPIAKGFFEDFYNRAWAALCSYAHSGVLQLGRRFTGHDVAPAYSDEEIVEITTTTTTCILIMAERLLTHHNFREDALATQALIKTYGENQ